MVPKFRAWNGYRKIMADYVSAIQNGDTQGTPSSVNVIVNGKNETWDIKNDHVELLQFTGLKDANGKDVYEGDILAWHSNIYRKHDWVGLVLYRGAGFAVQDDPKEFSTSTWLEVACSKDANIVEIVGNIHENPELLEAQHD